MDRKEFIRLTAFADKKAVESGVNLPVVHEPTFYTHWDLDEDKEDYFKAPEFTKKQSISMRDAHING